MAITRERWRGGGSSGAWSGAARRLRAMGLVLPASRATSVLDWTGVATIDFPRGAVVFGQDQRLLRIFADADGDRACGAMHACARVDVENPHDFRTATLQLKLGGISKASGGSCCAVPYS